MSLLGRHLALQSSDPGRTLRWSSSSLVPNLRHRGSVFMRNVTKTLPSKHARPASNSFWSLWRLVLATAHVRQTRSQKDHHVPCSVPCSAALPCPVPALRGLWAGRRGGADIAASPPAEVDKPSPLQGCKVVACAVPLPPLHIQCFG